MYRSFAPLRMTARRTPVILSAVKDLYALFTNSTGQMYPYPGFDIP